MSKLRVHRVNFFEPEAKAIHSLAYDRQSCRLAVSRSDSSIEIWNLKYKPFLEKVVFSEPSYSIECIVWCKGRLFSAGLHGRIIEYNPLSFTPKHTTAVSVGFSIWCMAVNKENTLLAAGTEDGHVSIYRVSETGLDFEKVLWKQEGRVLSLAWHESNEILVTGSIDTIRIYNVKSGQVSDRILVSRSEKNVETIVWCLAVTSDMTIISGDSCGRTSFWDGKTGTLLSSSTAHKADVLALCLSEDESTVYTSGVDPIIIMHVRSPIQSHSDTEVKMMWMKSVQRNIHTHDVRALQLAGEFLVSGGVDTNLVFSKFPPKTVIPFCPFSQASYCSVAVKKSCILLRYLDHLELWKLGKTSAETGLNGEPLPLSLMPVKLINVKCRSNEVITCSAVSCDSQWIAYSTNQCLNLFHIKLSEEPSQIRPTIQRVVLNLEDREPAKCLLFTSSGKLLVLREDEVLSIMFYECGWECGSVLYKNDLGISDGVHLMVSSDKGEYLAFGMQSGNVSVFNLITGKVHCTLPSYKCQPTAMAFDLESKNLIVSYSDRKIIEFNLTKKMYSNWCRRQNFTEFQHCSFYPIRGITFTPESEKHLLVYDEDAIYIFDRSIEVRPKAKRLKESAESRRMEHDEVSNESYKVIKKYKHLLGLELLQEDQIIVIEIQPVHIQESLPPPLQRKKYGT